MKNKIKIAVIPIDNRPICYDLIQDVLAINKNIELFMPPQEALGGLKTESDRGAIYKFLEDLDEVDYLIVALDTIAYGGLVSSRRSSDPYEAIIQRIEKFRELATKKAEKILGFSSIMRISNNNINEEEKEYWSDWGEKIFAWSYNSHKNKKANRKEIPPEILIDYITTRKRNYNVNRYYLDLVKEGFFDTLIYSKDDCAKYGINVMEANDLKASAKGLHNVLIRTGADEIPLSLISRVLTREEKVTIKPEFQILESKDLISKYEDISIRKCVLSQIAITNCEIDSKADLTMLINNFEKEQGDLVLGSVINTLKEKIEFPDSPFFIADVNNANGADFGLIEQLFKQDINNFYGYCGYNTSANTIGAAIFCAVVKFLAIKNKCYDDNAFKKYQFIRLLDDWAYQAISRKFVRESEPNFKEALAKKEVGLNLSAQQISKFLDYRPEKISYSLPWDRSFEIRIRL